MADDGSEGKSTRLKRLAAVGFVASVALLLCHELLLSVFVVKGVSMEPTLSDGQRVVVLKWFDTLARGDLVVFRNPTHPEEVLLKRILAQPGEEISGVGGKLMIGSSEVGEPYVKPGTVVGNLPQMTVGADSYYVLGDNRAASIDSRRFGSVARRLIVGKVVITLW